MKMKKSEQDKLAVLGAVAKSIKLEVVPNQKKNKKTIELKMTAMEYVSDPNGKQYEFTDEDKERHRKHFAEHGNITISYPKATVKV